TLRLHPGTFESLPPAWQTEVTRLLPELTNHPGHVEPPRLDSPGAQARFCAALVGTLAAALGTGRQGSSAGAVLAVEDVHWADDSSAEVLAYLVRRLREVPLLLVLTWRPESVSRISGLRSAVTDAVRVGLATDIELHRLDLPAVASLCAAALPGPPSEQTVGRLWQETGGLPLFVIEFLEVLRRGGRIQGEEQWRLPGGVRDLLEARLSGLSETTLQVLAAGAVLGGDMTPAFVRSTSGRGEEEVVAALEEAVARAAILETDRNGGSYEFRHDAMRRLVYDGTTLARRRLLHSRAADALAERRDGSAATVSAHLRLAGRDAESAEWSWRAAEQARSLYAHNQALEHLGAAAALGYPGHLVHQATGDVLTVLGRYRDALLAFEQAAAICPAADGPFLAMLEHRLADVHHRLGAWDVADSHLTSALDLLAPGGDPAMRARVLADAALVAHRRGDALAARSAANRALEAATSADDHAALAQAHDVLGVLASERDDVEEAERHLRDSLGHAARLTDPSYRCAALNNLALLQAAVGRPAEALATAREALRLGLEQGDRHRAAALHTNLADLLHDTGEQDEARRHLTSAARLFAGVDDEQLRRPEIWKLASW
ncbi:MAG: tetratricopeptide repeat protein, partial [Actinomycetota bacterium]|nr:tetratricopeptide repeat protein [Actinomycetota bacterium]